MVNCYPDTGTQGTACGNDAGDRQCVFIIGDDSTETAAMLYKTNIPGLIIKKLILATTNIDLFSHGYSVPTKSVEYYPEPLPKPKQLCFTERGHDWWYYNLFLPIPEKDIKINRVGCGNHSPPKGITTLSPRVNLTNQQFESRL